MKPGSPDPKVISVTIESLAFGGAGVARHEGMVVFVPGTIPEEKVEIRLIDQKKNFARGRLLTIDTPSPDRQSPPCSYYVECGGCQYQHLSYPVELAWKEKQVRELLSRIAKIQDPPLRAIIASPQPYGYRNRISVHADSGKVGFHREGTRDVVDIAECLLASSEVNQQLTALRVSQPRSGHYSLRSPRIPISAFFQSNEYLINNLLQLIVTAAEGSRGILVECYSGGGYFTAALNHQFDQVFAIEQDARALKDADKLNLPKVTWIEGRVEDHLPSVLKELPASPNLILLDPPRTGLDRELCQVLVDSHASKLVYVSCDPATMSRDALTLSTAYDLVSIQPIDMFPRTGQIETISIWEKKS